MIETICGEVLEFGILKNDQMSDEEISFDKNCTDEELTEIVQDYITYCNEF